MISDEELEFDTEDMRSNAEELYGSTDRDYMTINRKYVIRIADYIDKLRTELLASRRTIETLQKKLDAANEKLVGFTKPPHDVEKYYEDVEVVDPQERTNCHKEVRLQKI